MGSVKWLSWWKALYCTGLWNSSQASLNPVVKVELRKEESAVLILDGHHSHNRNSTCIDSVRRVILPSCVCLPTQVTNYSPWTSLSLALRKYVFYSEEVRYFLRSQWLHTNHVDGTARLQERIYWRTVEKQVWTGLKRHEYVLLTSRYSETRALLQHKDLQNTHIHGLKAVIHFQLHDHKMQMSSQIHQYDVLPNHTAQEPRRPGSSIRKQVCKW